MFSWTSFASLVMGFFNSLFNFGSKVIENMRNAELIAQGKKDQQAELAKDEIEINRQQTEILSKEVKDEETLKSLKDGDF